MRINKPRLFEWESLWKTHIPMPFFGALALISFALSFSSLRSPFFGHALFPTLSILASACLIHTATMRQPHWHLWRTAYKEFCLIAFFNSLILIILSSVTAIPVLSTATGLHTLYLIFFITGFISFSIHRERIQTILDNAQTHPDSKAIKAPSSSIPTRITLIKEWFKEQGLRTLLLLAFLIIAGLYLRIRYIDQLYFWIDEATSSIVAQRIAEGSGQTFMNGAFYGRAVFYHHYAALFIKLFPTMDLHVLLRIINTPFFIAIVFTLYYHTSKLINKTAGLFAVAIYTFSWISISIFREARFYELWLAFFLPFVFLFGRTLQTYIETANLNPIPFIKNHLREFITIVVLFGLSLDSQELTILTLYPLAVLGLFILSKKNLKGLILFSLAMTLILGALAYKHQLNSLSNILYFEGGPTIRSLYAKTPVMGVWENLLHNGYAYLLPVALVIIALVKIFKTNFQLAYLAIFTASWYLIVAFQGHDVKSIRYFYPLVPLAAILVAMAAMYLFALFQTQRIQRAMYRLIIVGIIAQSIYLGFIESDSALTNSSKNLFKNETFEQGLNFIRDHIDTTRSTVVTTNIWGMPYYIFFHRAPDYIVFDTSLIPFNEFRVDPGTGKREINYSDLGALPKPVYVIFNYPSQRIGKDATDIMNQLGTEVFREGNVRLYLIQ